MTDDVERIRLLLDDGMRERRERTASTGAVFAVFGALMIVLVLIKDPGAWWVIPCAAPLFVIAFMPKGRHDAAIRHAVLERPKDVVEITHHRGKPTVRSFGVRAATAKAIRNASRDRFYVWIVLATKQRAAVVLDEPRGTRLIELLGAHCPHVEVRHGLPEALAGLVVE